MAFNVLYITIYAFSAYFYKHTDFSKLLLKKRNKFLVLVPAYQSDEIIINTVKQNLKQSYPSNKYHILVIADGLKKETIDELIKHPISVIPVKFEESSKAKSINTVLAITPDYEYDYTVIIDVDNINFVDNPEDLGNIINRIDAEINGLF
jgi:cellulose synthase/poly-beta-1,6-N-acetylglucosamine synthase-like glycosyltransferase